MRLKLFIAILTLAIGVSACSRKPETEATAETSTQTDDMESTEDVRTIEVVESIVETSDAFQVVSAEVKGDILELTVSYGGGCQDHEWKMYATEKYAKSYPPKLSIFLDHNANGDMCKALLRETLKFDLTNIQYKGSDKLHLQMNNYKEFIIYEY